jgi:hypothetical protein
VAAAWWRRGSPWPWLGLLLGSGAVIAGIAWEVWPHSVDLSLVRALRPVSQTASPPTTERVRVRLFFPHTTKPTLAEEERDIPRRPVLADAVRAVLQELTRSAGEGTVAPFPPTAEVRHVFLDGFGILYLDCNQGIRALAAGDESRAALAVSAVVLSLTTNLSEVKRVQFLAEGRELSVQVGTTDLRRPLQPHFPEEESHSIISKPPGDEP